MGEGEAGDGKADLGAGRAGSWNRSGAGAAPAPNSGSCPGRGLGMLRGLCCSFGVPLLLLGRGAVPRWVLCPGGCCS